MALDIFGLFEDLKAFGEKRNWHLKYSKYNQKIHQSLLTHCLNVGALSYNLLDYLDSQRIVDATEKLRAQALLTGFLHDAGKDGNSYQKAVRDFLDGLGTDPLDFCHQQYGDFQPVLDSLRSELDSKLVSTLGSGDLWREIAWTIAHLGRLENAAAVSASFERPPTNDALICKEIVHLADMMMSVRSVSEAVSLPLTGAITSKLRLTYHKVSVVRGVLTQFLHEALESEFRSAGFEPVLWFPDGTVYVGKADLEVPKIDQEKLVGVIKQKIQERLSEDYAQQLAKAAYGNINATVIAAPEFLFLSDKVIHEFWQYIFAQKFAKPQRKGLDELDSKEKELYKQISDMLAGIDEDIKLTFLARFKADYNLLIVLYGIKTQLVKNAKGNKKKVEEEATWVIHNTLSRLLEISPSSLAEWPEIATQTSKELRRPVISALLQSPYYSDIQLWQQKFSVALEEATLRLAELWRAYTGDKYEKVAQLLVADIMYPSEPQALLDAVTDLTHTIEEGKRRGTPICVRCGGVAAYEAQAKLFGKSQIYHDLLAAGTIIMPGNKLMVCELCDFEEKLRSLFVPQSWGSFRVFYVFPQLALSRSDQQDWKKIIDGIKYQGNLPPITRIEKWADLIVHNQIPPLNLPINLGWNGADKRALIRAIQEVVDEEGLDDLSIMIDPPLEARKAETVASYLISGKCKLTDKYEKKVNESLHRVRPIYISPNFIVFIVQDIAEQDEPESSIEIKLLFIRCLLARMFYAVVLDGEGIRQEDVLLGYTTLPHNISLRSLVKRMGARKGWVPIPQLAESLKRLSALVLIREELLRLEADYGKSALLRLIDEEPGRVLVRATSKGSGIPKKLITYLEMWGLEDEKEASRYA